jgi:hypothetical protein
LKPCASFLREQELESEGMQKPCPNPSALLSFTPLLPPFPTGLINQGHRKWNRHEPHRLWATLLHPLPLPQTTLWAIQQAKTS